MRSSRLPYVRTLENFDFSFQPSIKREQIDALHELGLLERAENVVFLGPVDWQLTTDDARVSLKRL